MIGIADLLEGYETGYLGPGATMELFAELIRTGWVWNLRRPLPPHGARSNCRRLHHG